MPAYTAISNGVQPSFPCVFGLAFLLKSRYSVISMLPEPQAACKQLNPDEPTMFRSKSDVLARPAPTDVLVVAWFIAS